MDHQSFINATFGSVLAVGGWLARELWGVIKELRRDLHKMETELPKIYVTKIDIDKRMEHIESMFQRISDKLDSKADKFQRIYSRLDEKIERKD